MMRIKVAARAAFAVALFGMAAAVTTPARAAVEVGLLSCRSADSATYVFVSDQPFNCVFTPSVGGPVQYYQANIHRIGAQAGFNSSVALEWAVFAPAMRVGPGSLAGIYGGFSAGAAFGVGVGANGLVGSNNSFALQPVSFEGQAGGVNVIATATEVELHPVLPVHHYGHYHHHH